MTEKIETTNPATEEGTPLLSDTSEPGASPEDVSGASPEVDDTSTIDDTPDTGNNPNREAAKYRRQLRDVEAERDTLSEQLAAARQEMLNTAALNWRAGAGSIHPEALDQAGLTPEGFFDDAGKLDEAALDERMTELKQQYRHMFQPHGLYVPNEGRSPSNQELGNAWEEAFKPPQH